MIEMGIIVGIALLVSMCKMNWSWRMRILSNPLFVDIIVFALLVLLHWGTFSGVMVATIGALVCSLMLSAGRRTLGFIQDGDYQPGYLNVAHKLS